MKYYAIADLHGRYDLLLEAVNKIYDHAGEGDYKIITLGDYIDRGPQSQEIISFLMKQGDSFICLKGNHEDMMIQSIVTPLDPDWWVGNGGGTTLLSYGHPDVKYMAEVSYAYVPEEHIKWMSSLPLYYETEKQVFVHAGIPDNKLPLDKQDEEKMMWMLYNPTDMGGWQGKHVVHGHHQFADGPHEYLGGQGGRTDLDVFAWHEGRIVIGVFDDTQGHALEFIEVFAS